MTRRNLMFSITAIPGLAAVRTFAQTAAQTAAPTAGPAPSGPFTLPPLGYAYDALEPYIDAQTMQIHHDKHHKAYVDNLNKAVASYPALQNMSVDDLQRNLESVPEGVKTAIRNQGGGDANHSLFWKTLAKSQGAGPKGDLATDIEKTFGGFDQFKTKLSTTAVGVFGSGWGWLVLDKGTLRVMSLPNQDSPLAIGVQPVFGIDVWEHAYYLKYQNRRPEYVNAIWNCWKWDYINDRYATLKKA